jgi:hypothetical protein
VERLRALMRQGSGERKVEFVRDLVTSLLADEGIYSDEVLFRDAVEEIYEILRREVIEGNKKELADAYELAVILRALAFGRIGLPDQILNELERALEV